MWGNFIRAEPSDRVHLGSYMSGRGEGDIREQLPPETLLNTDQYRVIRAGIACMHDVDTIQEYVAHENQHQRRRWVLRMLADRAATLRESAPEDGSAGSQTHGLY